MDSISTASAKTKRKLGSCILLLFLTFMNFICSAQLKVLADSKGEFPKIGKLEDYNRSVDLSDMAEAYAKKGKTAEAIACYRQSIAIYPHDSASYNNLAKIFCDCGEPKQAIANYKKAIELEPNYLDAWIGLGFCYEKSGNLNDSEMCCRKAIEIRGDLNNIYDLCCVLRAQGKYKEAVKYLLLAKDLSKSESQKAQLLKEIEECRQQTQSGK